MGEQLAEVWVAHEKKTWKQALGLARELLERVGLEAGAADLCPFELSGGMRQRAAIAMAVALSPDLVVVDEPTSALDVVSANTVVDVLNRLREETGAAFLVVSHDMSVIARTCERASVMHEGGFVEEGETAGVLEAPASEITRRLVCAVPRLPVPEEGGAE
jgi:ABC-type glutathione transport system ATPase component